jgi:single-stranded-DNA-specific exonuclease
MVPLQNENRVLAYWGLRVMRKSPRPGFRMLLASAKVDQKNLSEDDVTFMVTPRINAASRMGTPMDAFRLLATDDEKEAAALVLHLEKINTERKTLVATIMKKVKKTLEEREEKDIIVIGDPSWRIGILGLVAGKVCEEYSKPTFVWGREGSNGGSVIKGSCRSPKGTNVVEIMRGAGEAFIDVGGHAQAGGFSVAEENIHTLEEKLQRSYQELATLGFSGEGEVVEDPVILPLGSLYEEHYDAITSFAPFGFGNPKPVFHFLETTVGDAKLFGKEKNHLELTLAHGKGERKAISFFVSDAVRDNLPKRGASINLLGTLEVSYFAGRTTKRIRIEKIL